MEPFLNALRIRYTVIRRADELRKGVIRASRAAFSFMSPVAVVISGDLTMEDGL